VSDPRQPPPDSESPEDRPYGPEPAPGPTPEQQSALASRLDPSRAVAAAGGRPPLEPVIDTRRYQWAIGIFGLVLVIAFSVYLFASNGIVAPGIPAGKTLYRFVAPLATGKLTGDVNTRPRCDPTAPNPQALNICGRTPLVLAFFVTGSGSCKHEVDTLQTVSRQFPGIQFAAVAVDAGRSETAALVRSHHWTIPIAFDPDDALGKIYGVEICPMVELAQRGGRVIDRLIGEKWLHPADLAAKVRGLRGST
jgi:peroxiredoxin